MRESEIHSRRMMAGARQVSSVWDEWGGPMLAKDSLNVRLWSGGRKRRDSRRLPPWTPATRACCHDVPEVLAVPVVGDGGRIGCRVAEFKQPRMVERVAAWRTAWSNLTQAEKRNSQHDMLVQARGSVEGSGRRTTWTFLGVPLCLRAWRRITGINPWRSSLAVSAGHVHYIHGAKPRAAVLQDQIHGAIWVVVRHFLDSSPLQDADPEQILLPFREKVYLYRLILLWNARQEALGTPMFYRRPSYRLFLKVLARPEFAKVTFHRVVPMARCPKCCLFRFKCMSVPRELRPRWQALAAAHQWLQIAQKRTYAADRAVAASDYPRSEIYMALDGGSGYEFVLPHQSPQSPELPSKAIASFHTVPMKVMNGLVHGDTRSHVILSPGTIFAGASHTCESIAVLMNTAYAEHGDLPRRASVQLDNAATNHNMLVLTFMGLYVGVETRPHGRLGFRTSWAWGWGDRGLQWSPESSQSSKSPIRLV